MCGISGILNFKIKDDNFLLDLIKNFNRDLKHRGPNNSDIWHDKNNYCYLGHTRLSILDLSNKGNQPMVDRDKKFVISFNGEIYNFREIRKTLILLGVKFSSSSDTEILLEGFKIFGKSFIHHLDGMFAFAIYDIEEQKLYIYRDRAGEKPLYYVYNENLFAFSSEFKSLLNLKKIVNFSISKQSIFEFLALRYIPNEKTIFNEIKKLQPGCFIEILNKNNIQIKRYFSFNVYPEERSDKKESHKLIDKVHYILKKSIYNRLNSDVPLGVFLSGGIDSSLTSSIVTKDFNRNLNTFSIGFENYNKSEHHYAKNISQQIGSNHNEIILTNNDVLENFENIGNIMDDLNGDRSLIPTYLVSKFAKEKVTVALSGDAADELFGGYPRHWELANKYNSYNKEHNPDKILETYLGYFLPYYNVFDLKKLDKNLYEKFIDQFNKHYLHEYRSIASSTREFDFNSYLQIVLSKVDNASMKNSLEVRTPFLNNELIQIASELPDQILFNGKFPKLILRIILDNYISNEITTLPKKGFGLPIQNFSFLEKNKVSLYNDSIEILKNINFFKSDHLLINFIKEHSLKNHNSLWGLYAMAKWFESLNLNL